MRKYGRLIAVAALLCFILSGCKSVNDSDAGRTDKEAPGIEAVKLHVLTNRVDLIESGVLESYAERFAELYPGVSVQFEGLGNYATDIMVRLSTRNLGDVLLIPNNVKNEHLSQYFEPLPDEMFENARFTDFKSYGGKRYGIATGASATGIVYNKKAFLAAGISDIPVTLEQFYEACEKLKKAGITPIYLNYGARWPLMNWGEDMVSYITGNPEYLNEMAGQDEPWSVDNAWGQAISIVKTLIERDYVEKGLITNQWEASKRELADGRAGMYLMGNWVINQLVAVGANADDIGFFPFPYSDDDVRYAPISPDWFVGVSKFSTNKELARQWVDYFVHESGYVDDSGFLPVDMTRQPTLPQYKQFLSYNAKLVEKTVPNDRILEISNAAQIMLWSGENIQEWIAAPSLADVFSQYNKRWMEARKITSS